MQGRHGPDGKGWCSLSRAEKRRLKKKEYDKLRDRAKTEEERRARLSGVSNKASPGLRKLRAAEQIEFEGNAKVSSLPASRRGYIGTRALPRGVKSPGCASSGKIPHLKALLESGYQLISWDGR